MASPSGYRATFVTFVIVAAILVWRPLHASEWTEDEMIVRLLGHTHHWGQKGQAIPNNGWSDYKRMTLDLGAKVNIYHQSRGEFFAAVYIKDKDDIELLAMSIPRAGIFYTSLGALNCSPDRIEYLGLMAETVLSLLGTAFPEGPGPQAAGGSVRVKQPSELRFMGGFASTKREVWHRVELIYQAPLKFRYTISYDDGTTHSQGEWEAIEGPFDVPDEEPLSNWLSCWAGTHSTGKDGSHSFKPDLKDSGGFKTFGDVRQALRTLR